MLRKRVPVIVPLHEVANSAAATALEDASATTGQENPSASGSALPSPAAAPAPPPALPPLKPATLPPLLPPPPPPLPPPPPPPPPQLPPDPAPAAAAAKPPMRPLRKNKRLRPAVPSHSGEDSADDAVSRLKISKLRDDRARAGRTSSSKGAGDGASEVGPTPAGSSKPRARRGDRDVSSSGGSDSHGSTVCSPASSVLGSNDDVSTEALMKITSVAKQENIVWTKIKGHPYWPTQHVRMCPEIEAQDRFQKATKFRRKVDDTCVMYFGTCEVAFVNAEKSCIPWDEGLRRNMHLSHKSRVVFQRSLAEVKAYCHRQTRYPRGWWCEPQCMVLAAEFYDHCVTEGIKKKLKDHITRAEDELIFWAKLRGFPHWPVQVLPRNLAREEYPQLKLSAENSTTSSSLPCMFFGTGEVAMVPEKNLTPFGAGLIRGYVTTSDRQDFAVATGELWGYLQEPRIWPSGFLSGQLWWNYKETTEAENKPEDDVMDIRVPHMPEYEHIRKSVWAEGVEPPPKPKKFEFSCCGCTSNGRDICCADSHCLNFASRFLCNPATCLAGLQCANMNFHKRKTPRMKPFFTADQRGWGLRVEEPVKSGSFVIEYVGEIIDRDILDKRLKTTQQQKSSEYYMMDLTNDLLVDAKFKGNLSRFINSSCEPNCQTQKWIDCSTGQTHVGIFAVQDIPEGVELTYNYCFEDYGLSGKRQKRSFMCQCGTSSCSMLEPIEKKLMKKLLGKRLEVRWDDGWYPGVVELYNLKKKRFRVQYDDGDCEDLVLGLPLAEDDGVAFRLVEDEPTSEVEEKEE